MKTVTELKKVYPTTVDEISQLLQEEGPFLMGEFEGFSFPNQLRQVFDTQQSRAWKRRSRPTVEETLEEESIIEVGTNISFRKFKDVIDFRPDDHVVVVRAGTTYGDLEHFLKVHQRWLPLCTHICFGPVRNRDGNLCRGFVRATPISIGDSILLNLPNGFASRFGSWRDWIVGMRVALADGRIVEDRFEGYDLGDLFTASRGTYGVIVEVSLKTWPLDERQKPLKSEIPIHDQDRSYNWIQRVADHEFEDAVRRAGDSLFVADQASNALWCHVPPDQDLQRYPGDWVLRRGCGEKNLQITDPTLIKYMTRAKDIFDPTRKLNPGEMGIF